MNSYNNMIRNVSDTPVIPLPNPGEGGPTANGNAGSNIPVTPLPSPDTNGSIIGGGANIPMAPLPEIGAGRPVIGGGANIPMAPLPEIGAGPPVNSGGGSNFPVYPLPNPGEGPALGGGNNNPPIIIQPEIGGGNNFPVFPLPGPGVVGPVPNTPYFSIITMLPRPNIPCFFCNSNQSANVRFLNAANGYNEFLIYVNNRLVVNGLGFAEVSQYGRVASGFQNITISGTDGYIYVQKTLMFNSGNSETIAITRTPSGLDLTEINDTACATPGSTACFRACNLSYNSGPLDVILNNGYMIFNDVRFREVTPFSRIRSGEYQFFVTKSNNRPFGAQEALVTAYINARPNSTYTLYMFNWNDSPDAIRTLVVEDRR